MASMFQQVFHYAEHVSGVTGETHQIAAQRFAQCFPGQERQASMHLQNSDAEFGVQSVGE